MFLGREDTAGGTGVAAMKIADRMKLKFVSLTLMLSIAAVLATRAAAEEAIPSPSEGKATTSEPHAPGSVPADGNPVPASDANTEAIDTRIAVQPHGPPGKFGRLGNTANPIQPIKLINAHRRTFSPSRPVNRVLSNASGIPGAQHLNVQQSLGERFEHKSLEERPAIGPPIGAGGAGLGLAKPGSSLAHPPGLQWTGSPTLGANAKTPIRGGIGGASLNQHRIAGTSGIGGPARAVTGINGSLIRETR